jgi:hypothetical protein
LPSAAVELQVGGSAKREWKWAVRCSLPEGASSMKIARTFSYNLFSYRFQVYGSH